MSLQNLLELAYKNNQLLNVKALDTCKPGRMRKGAYSIVPKTNVNATLGQVNMHDMTIIFNIPGNSNPTLTKARRC